MKLRDTIALEVLKAMIHRNHDDYSDEELVMDKPDVTQWLCDLSYEIADRMMKARKE